MAALTEYLWIAVLAVIFGFIMAFGIGANDVANAFASSVAAKSLSLRNAVIAAAIFEFAGALLLGAKVTGTIRGKILISSYYVDSPDILMFGNLCALMVASFGLLVATKYEYPISTTHTIIAALMGFSVAANGFKSVDWWPWGGKIFISWVTSPLLTGILSFMFFSTVKYFVLESADTFRRATNCFPIVVFVTITINLFFILFKSNNNITVEDYGHRVVLPVSLGGGALCALITWFIVIPYLKVRVTREQDEHDAAMALDDKKTEGLAGMEEGSDERQEDSTTETDNKKDSDANVEMMDASLEETVLKDPISGTRNTMTASLRATWKAVADKTYNQDLETQSFAENSKAKAIWDNSSVYDAKTERLFSYLQVFTACMTSFAHGSNDIANAIAPVSAVLDIYKTGKFDSHAPVHEWVLALGGIGIVFGLALYGYNIMRAVGFKLTCITPSRGFCIELATALAVSLASYMQIPVSSTQCLVGATVGAGIASGGFKQVQWFFLFRVATGWVGTFFITAVVTAGLFSFATYSPSL